MSVLRTAISKSWGFVSGVNNRMEESSIFLVSAGVGFYAMFAVFPALTATLTTWSLVADPRVIRDYLEVVEEFIPDEAYQIIADQITTMLEGPRATLSWATGFSIMAALFSARAGVNALMRGVSLIHGATPRTGIGAFIFAIVMTIALVGVVLAALVLVVVVPVLIAFQPFALITEIMATMAPWILMFVLVLVAIGILYRYGPSKQGRRLPFFTVGALVAAVAWGLISIGFSFYLANFGSYNRVYGSIGAVIALLMWFYLSSFSVLFGAVINAELSGYRAMRLERASGRA